MSHGIDYQGVIGYQDGHMSPRGHMSHVTCHMALELHVSPIRHLLPEEAHITMTSHSHTIVTSYTPFRSHVTRVSHVTCDTSLETSHITNTQTSNTNAGQGKVRSGSGSGRVMVRNFNFVTTNTKKIWVVLRRSSWQNIRDPGKPDIATKQLVRKFSN